jgi:tRNA(Ile)-lysidine synthase
MRPLTDAAFADAMQQLGVDVASLSQQKLAVAVSGGADSMALTLLIQQWGQAHGVAVVGLTVDHRLRSESAVEAAQVQQWLHARGIAHETLVWQQAPLAQNGASQQAAARQARYQLLENWCSGHACPLLLTAHQRDDVAEHLLLRLKRGSGLYGLAAPASVQNRVWGETSGKILRPLLGFGHQDCVDYLQQQGQAWIEDPSNQDSRYDRVRIRQLLRDYPDLLPSDRLAEASLRLHEARAVVESVVEQLRATAVTMDAVGGVILQHAVLAAALPEVRWRLLASLLQQIGNTPYPPRFDDLQRLWEKMGGDKVGGARQSTLNHCIIRQDQQGNWRLSAENSVRRRRS